ncbi:MAG: class I tRNA ligase family protein, partial [bacterium]|nr:class I tRNA ligase family protein [bacterium]
MFHPVDPKPNFPKMEEEVLDFWREKKIFEKSLKKTEGQPAFVFFEGPPTANGHPGLHHVEARAFKDVILRFQTMMGKHVLRKAGWDAQGLPVEIEVEKSLGISGKRGIENLVPGDRRASIEKFNRLCRENVWKYKDEWEQFTDRMGFWIDMTAPYVTYDNNYIETVWWIIKELWNKKLVYQGHKVMPFCTRCGTALSSHEVAQGYKNIEEKSVFIKFKVKAEKIEGRDSKGHQVVVRLDKPTYILSWTTTPWTLPGNVALAVGEKIDYAVVAAKEEYYILAADLVGQVCGEGCAVLEKF